MRLIGYRAKGPRTPHGSVAGSDAWSSESSGKKEGGGKRAGRSTPNALYNGGHNSASCVPLPVWETWRGALETNMSVVIQQVVGELEGVEGHGLLHPLGSTGRRVWVEVHPAGGYDISSSCHQPGGAVERISGTRGGGGVALEHI